MKLNKKKITILICLFFFLLVYFLLSSLIFAKNEGLAKLVRDNTPFAIKNFLKQTVFIIPTLKKQNLILERNFKSLKENYYEQQLSIKGLQNKLKSGLIIFDGTIVSENKNQYNLKKISLPFYNLTETYKNKKQGYILIVKNEILFFFWSGKIVRINKKELHNGETNFYNIENNLDDFFIDHHFKWTGVKDAIYYKDEIYLSYTNKIKDNCYSVGVLKSKKKYNLSNLTFEKFFNFKECVNIENTDKFSNKKYFGGFQAGGRLGILNGDLLLTIGDYRTWNLPQNENSNFGKILKINLESKESEILSMGHRNPQGLLVINQNLILSSEHGPNGGDEINLIKAQNYSKIQNFGWPISSKGSHYKGVNINSNVKKIAPLHNSHIEHGFIEPKENFTPGIGISQISKTKNDNIVFVSSLKNMQILKYRLDIQNEDLILEDKFQFNERIRDIIYDQEYNLHYIFFESSPSLGILDNK